MAETKTRLVDGLSSWNRRTLVIGGIIILIAAFLAWSIRPQPIPADFAPVTRGSLTVTVDDEGETRVRNSYLVSAPVAGRVDRIELDVGDPVIAGKTVLALFQPQDPALLDPRAHSEAEAGVRLALADKARAEAEREYARLELRRAEQLRQESNISEAALNKAQLAVKVAQSAVDQATATVSKRQADQESSRAAMAAAGSPNETVAKGKYVQVRAPVSGRVLKRLQQSEGLLPAGTPLLEIGDPTDLEIVTDLLSADAVKVREGNSVIIEEWGGAKPLAGKVKRIEPFGFTKVSALGVEEQRVNVIVDFTSPREDMAALGHGYRVMTRIVILDRSNAIKIPIGALFRNGEDWAVFMNDGDFRSGRARLQNVELGSRNSLEAEIKNGLTEGQLVIVHPSDQVAAGVRVEARRAN